MNFFVRRRRNGPDPADKRRKRDGSSPTPDRSEADQDTHQDQLLANRGPGTAERSGTGPGQRSTPKELKMQGDELRALRKGAGLTQEELANLIGMSPTYVGQMERGLVPIERRTELAVEGMLRERIDVSYSDAIGKWIVAVTRPGKAPVMREHHLIAAKPTRAEAMRRAAEEQERNPFAKLLVHD